MLVELLKIAVIKNYVDEASAPVKDALNLTIEKLKNAGHEIC